MMTNNITNHYRNDWNEILSPRPETEKYFIGNLSVNILVFKLQSHLSL